MECDDPGGGLDVSQRPKMRAEEYADQATAADMSIWLTFVPRGPSFEQAALERFGLDDEESRPYVTVDCPEKIDTWLQRFPPSEVRR